MPETLSFPASILHSCERDVLLAQIIWNTSGLAYLSTTLTTPVFLVVPVVGVWAGYFPLEFTRMFALAFTIYALCSHLLLYYCKDLKHIRSIYFSICAAHVFWFAYAKACVNTLIAAFMNKVGAHCAYMLLYMLL